MSQVGWLGSPSGPVAAGNRSYEAGKYDEASQKYSEALVDAPDSPVIRFDLAAAQYKQGKFGDALASLRKIRTEDDAKRAARIAYNLGNTQFRLGQSSAEKDPTAAITAYEQALTAYKRAMGADPSDVNTKFNHEFVEQQLAELRKKLEEQKQQQEQQKQQQEQQKEQQDQQQQQQGEQQQQEQQKDDQQQGAGNEPQPTPTEGEGQGQNGGQRAEEQPQEQQGAQAQQSDGEGTSDDQKQMDQRQAHGVIDTARQEEIRPDEITREGIAGVAEPREDW